MTVDARDELSRLIRPKQKYYITNNGEVKTAAFSIGKDGAVSVFVTTGMSSQDVWDHADAHFPVEVVGRACLDAKVVFDEGLTINRDDTPPKHANITGFPGNPELNLAKRQALASKAVFEKR